MKYISSVHGRWQRGGSANNICTVLAQFNAAIEFLGTLPIATIFNAVLQDFHDRQISTCNCFYRKYDQVPLSSVFINHVTGSKTIVSAPNFNNQPWISFDHFKKLNFNHYQWIHFEVGYIYYATEL